MLEPFQTFAVEIGPAHLQGTRDADRKGFYKGPWNLP
jgi:hypothetical protein